MFSAATDWNPKQKRLREIILVPEQFDEAKNLLSAMHAELHSGEIYGKRATFMDEVWRGMDDRAFRTMPTIKDVTCAWNIWHITRIEDLTANILVARGAQVLDDDWLHRLGTSVTDTANAMTDDEIIAFSNEVSLEALKEYRDAVGKQTKQIIADLHPEDMKRRVAWKDLSRILSEGGVTGHKDSSWLLDFWGKKNIAGLILMPITRHQVGHLNDCRKLKKTCRRMKN